MKKRLLALLLCLVMVIGLVPFALADGEFVWRKELWTRRQNVPVNFYNDLMSTATTVKTIEVEIGTAFTKEQYNEAR